MRSPCGRSYVRGMTQITSTELEASPPSAAWLRVMALVYDPFLWLGELAGLRVSDVAHEELVGTDCIYIVSDEKAGRRIKTKQSARLFLFIGT